MGWRKMSEEKPVWGDNIMCELKTGEHVFTVVASDEYMAIWDKIKKWCLYKEYKNGGYKNVQK